MTPLGFVLLGDCPFPKVLRRERFFDAARGALPSFRAIKGWLLNAATNRTVPPDLDEWRRAIADKPGVVAHAVAEMASRFADACGGDFEAVWRLDCAGLSPAGVLGEIAAAVGLRPDQLQDWTADHRVLFVMSRAAEQPFLGGRASMIFTDGPIDGALPNAASDAVRQFRASPAVQSGWSAVKLLKEQWRLVEVLEILDAMARLATPEMLKYIEREQYWNRADIDYEGPEPLRVDPTIGGQLSFAFEAA